MNDVFEKIKALIAEKTSVNESRLGRNTRLYEDLKIEGDDAFELLESFKEKFKVDMTDFNYNEYFSGEGIDLIGAIVSIFKRKKKRLKSITIADLEKAAVNGMWTV
jgi:acyl carrier protein